MKMLDRYFAADAEGDARIASALQSRPFTCIFGFAFLMSIVGASVFVVVYSDTSEERWLHMWQSTAFVALLGVIAGYFFRREKREPLSRPIRRLALRLIVFSYAACVISLVAFSFTPYAKGTGVSYTLLRLGICLPVPLMAWHALKRDESG
jgi:hypothetical protein